MESLCSRKQLLKRRKRKGRESGEIFDENPSLLWDDKFLSLPLVLQGRPMPGNWRWDLDQRKTRPEDGNAAKAGEDEEIYREREGGKKERLREWKRVCVCVCVWERERERGKIPQPVSYLHYHRTLRIRHGLCRGSSPFTWCYWESLSQISRKQKTLRNTETFQSFWYNVVGMTIHRFCGSIEPFYFYFFHALRQIKIITCRLVPREAS